MRIRDRIRSGRVSPAGRTSGRRRVRPLDSKLSYRRGGQEWTYEGGRILLDTCDVQGLISDGNTPISSLIGIASGLSDYKKRVKASAKRPLGVTKFLGLVDALIEISMGKVKGRYDDKVTGLQWNFEDGELIINGVNVHQILLRFCELRTPPLRKFLEGLRTKVEMLLANHGGAVKNESARQTLLAIKRKMDRELAVDSDHLLPDGNSDQ
jgi:hypothetical protein